MSGMESFIEKQTKLLEMQPAEVPEKDREQIPKGCVDGYLSDPAVPAQDLSTSDPGKQQGPCSYREGSHGIVYLGLVTVGICPFNFSSV